MESTCPVHDVTEFIDFDSFRQLSRALFDLKLLTCKFWNWKGYNETVNGVLPGFGCSFKIDNKKTVHLQFKLHNISNFGMAYSCC